MKPFADDSAATAVGALNIENGLDRIAVYGSLDLTRDKAGLRSAHDLKKFLEAVIEVLEADSALPNEVAPVKAKRTTGNPFS